MNIFSSLNLYFQTFEFNAGVYYLLREVGYQIKGYNVIGSLGPGLGLTGVLGVLGLAWIGKSRAVPLPHLMLLALTLYFLLATIVHLWYVTGLVALGIFTPWLYPSVWSAAVVVSYAAYSQVPYREDLRWVLAEYLVVLLAVAGNFYRSASKASSPIEAALR